MICVGQIWSLKRSLSSLINKRVFDAVHTVMLRLLEGVATEAVFGYWFGHGARISKSIVME